MTPTTPPTGRNPGQRTLAAIVFTDVVSFSARMQSDEVGTLKLLQRDFEEMGRICAEHEGAVLKTTGDGLLLTFTSAVQAVACALAMQRQFAAEAKGQTSGGALQHRIGIHLGDVLVQDQDVMGDGVNIASRLQAEAEPGGICISQTVYDVVKNKLEMNVVSLGARELKNISQAMPVYQLLLEAQGLDAAGQPRPHAAGSAGSPGRRKLLYIGGAVAALLVVLLAVVLLRHRAQKNSLADAAAAPAAMMPAVVSSASASPAATPAPAPIPPAPVAAPDASKEKGDLASDLASEFNKRRDVMQQLHTLYLDKYDFDGLVRALRDKAESPGAAPALKQMLRSAEQLVAVKTWLDNTLRRYNQQHPLLVHDLSGDATKDVGVFLASDLRVTILENGTPKPHDWADLKPAVVGAIIVSDLHEMKRTQRNITMGAQVFARFYALPAMTEALTRASTSTGSTTSR
jgi:class 3 adenylate cyclase